MCSIDLVVHRGAACLWRLTCAWVLVPLLACGHVCVQRCAEVLYRCAVCLLDPMVVRVPQLIAREALAWMRYVCCAWLVLSCVPPCVGVQGRAAIRARLINVLCAVSA
jgi:hypothetical protein